MNTPVVVDRQASPDTRRWRSIGEIVAVIPPDESDRIYTIGRPAQGSSSPSHVRLELSDGRYHAGCCLLCQAEIDEDLPWALLIIRDGREDVCLQCACADAVIIRSRAFRRIDQLQVELADQWLRVKAEPERQSHLESFCHVRDLLFLQQLLAYGVATTAASAHAIFDAAVRA